jgi:hypothetical protein
VLALISFPQFVIGFQCLFITFPLMTEGL